MWQFTFSSWVKIFFVLNQEFIRFRLHSYALNFLTESQDQLLWFFNYICPFHCANGTQKTTEPFLLSSRGPLFNGKWRSSFLNPQITNPLRKTDFFSLKSSLSKCSGRFRCFRCTKGLSWVLWTLLSMIAGFFRHVVKCTTISQTHAS